MKKLIEVALPLDVINKASAREKSIGGGSIPLEAQRLELKAFANDLNPVAVTINKAMIEIPAKFKNLPPINPDFRKSCRKFRQCDAILFRFIYAKRFRRNNIWRGRCFGKSKKYIGRKS